MTGPLVNSTKTATFKSKLVLQPTVQIPS